ncbi:MAG: hypothetical protein K0R68_2133, partial [Mycobacterium sp.]|nr:hypothetical protein [Mycobacterium sp.]
MFHTRTALALSSIALTLSLTVTGMPHASADPYDGDDSSEAAPDYEAPDYQAPDYEAPEIDSPEIDAPEFEPPDVSDPGIWDQGTDAYPAPDTDEAPEPSASEPDSVPTAVDTPEADTPEANTPEVPQGDVDLAENAAALDAAATVATQTEVTELREQLDAQIASGTVTQWDSSWVGYDSYYRPIITNPYRAPMQIVYTYDNTTRIVDVAPLQRAVLAVPTPGVYSFTAVTQNGSGKPVTVSTGSFSGGGYVPAAGQQPPKKPQPPTSYQNVLVQLRYSTGSSQPFRVKKLTDLGNDLADSTHRVLLDDETPAWGTWAKTSAGERIFEISKTQQLPGLTAPAEGPLPGYDVTLANSQAAPAKSGSVDPLVLTAVGCGALGLASVAFFVITGRRRGDGPDGAAR